MAGKSAEFLLRNKRLAALVALLGIAIFLSINSSIAGGDTTTYYISAKSLAQGSLYIDISKPYFSPFLYYPPLYPVLVSFAFLIFGEGILWMKLISLVFSALSIFLVHWFAERRFSRKVAFLATLSFSLNLLFVWYSARALSEATFLFLSLMAIFFVTAYSSDKKPFSINFFLSSLFIAASCLARTIGIVLFPALLIFSVYRKQFRKFLPVLILAALLVAPWFLYTAFSYPQVPRPPSYFQQFWQKDASDASKGIATAGEISGRVVANTSFYLLDSIPQTVFSPLDIWAWFLGKGGLSGILFTLSALAVLAVLLLSLRRHRRHGFGFSTFYLALYLALLIAFPYTDVSAVDRFLLPVLPFLIFAFVRGLLALDALVRGRLGLKLRKQMIASLVLGIMVVGSLGSSAYCLITLHGREFSAPYNELAAANQWIKKNTPQEAVVWSTLPHQTFIMSGRKSVRLDVGSADELVAALEKYGVSYLLSASYPGPEKRFVPELAEAGILEKVYESGSGKTGIYRVTQPAAG